MRNSGDKRRTLSLPVMSDNEFLKFSSLVYDACGIKMPPAKQTMLVSRLSKRLRELGISSFGEYYDFLVSAEGKAGELFLMIDVVTTNKTDFLREPSHFDMLARQVVPDLISRRGGKGVERNLNIWSAACSTGEEPYTIAMILAETASRDLAFRFKILATDVCSQVLEKASMGIYVHDRVQPLPMELRKKYLMKSRNDAALVRIVPGLRSRVRFRRLNFMDRDFGINEMMDVVFCRNVLIYFDRATQEKVLGRICRYLAPGGYLFLGHSESIHGLNVPVTRVSATVYQRN